MFKKLSEFFIKNIQIAIILLLAFLIGGIASWFLAAKQYNPSITTPIFQVSFIAPGVTKEEVNTTIVDKLENRLAEIEGIEHVISKSIDNAGIIQIQFYTGTDLAVAKARVLNKMAAVSNEIPSTVQRYYYAPVDMEDIPVYQFSVSYKGKDKTEEEIRLQINEIQADIVSKLKYIKNSSVFYELGGSKANLNVRFDIDKLNSKGIDLLQVVKTIQENNKSYPGGDFYIGDTKNTISVSGELKSADSILNLIVGYRGNSPIYISDVADVTVGISDRKDVSFVNNGNGLEVTGIIGIAKKKGSNVTVLASDVQKELKKIQKDLPEGYKITEFYNEGQRASDATNELIINLVSSLLIVFGVLYVYMGARRALIVALAIPLTFLIVFTVIYITGDNINRVTLAALIVALGILVDDSTVVVDNINQNSQKPEFKGKDLIETISYSVNEVGTGLLLALLTRVTAFSAMFMVTGSMGQFIGPIPTYVIMSMVISNFLALTITPFFYYFLKRNVKVVTKENDETDKLTKLYEKYIHSIIGKSERQIKKRRKVVFRFIVGLILSFTIPISLGLINQTSTPKADQEDLTIFIDLPRNTSLKSSEEITKQIDKTISCFIVGSKDCEEIKEDTKENKIIENVIYNVGIAPLADNATMVRGGPGRKGEHYISIKLDLKRKSERNIESTEFNLILSKLIKPQILEFNPLAKVKILDTSPGVPRKAEFEIEITTPYKKDKEELTRFNTYLYEKIKKDLNESLVKDHYTDVENYQNKYEIKLNHELITRSGLSSTQVGNTLTMIFSGAEISEVNDLRYKSANNIFVSVLREQKNTEEVFNRITFTNNRGKKVYLKDISELIIKENKQDFNNYDRKPVSYIVGETTYDSIAQVVEKIKGKTDSNKFWAGKYKVVSKDNMNTTIIDTKLGTEFNLKYNGDWKTMKETVGELRSAIVLAFIAIFIFMVIKFKSFAIGGVIMTTFIFGFIGIIPGFAMLYLINGTLFSSIGNLGVLSLIGIVTGNAIILIEQYLFNKSSGDNTEEALSKSAISRFGPIIATNTTTTLGLMTLITDSVWGSMAWTMTFGLIMSVVLVLLVLPVFLYNVFKNQ